MSDADGSLPKYATIEGWGRISSMGRRTIYDEIGRGNLVAIKVRGRTLIDVDASLAWMRSCPQPKIRAPRERPGRNGDAP